jgi:hypothetical protein
MRWHRLAQRSTSAACRWKTPARRPPTGSTDDRELAPALDEKSDHVRGMPAGHLIIKYGDCAGRPVALRRVRRRRRTGIVSPGFVAGSPLLDDGQKPPADRAVVQLRDGQRGRGGWAVPGPRRRLSSSAGRGTRRSSWPDRRDGVIDRQRPVHRADPGQRRGLVADEQKRCVSGVRRWPASGSRRGTGHGSSTSPSETDAPDCRA